MKATSWPLALCLAMGGVTSAWAAAPTVSTGATTALTGTAAQLNGGVNPGGEATTAWFRYSVVSPGTCNDTFGTRAPLAGGSAVPAGSTSVLVSQAVTGLSAATTYYFCAIAQNASGTGVGAVQSFTTPAPPTVTTNSASSVTSTGANLRGTGNANGAATSGTFRYGLSNPGTCSNSFGARAPVVGNAATFTSNGYPFFQYVSGLSAGTTYFYCAVVESAEGTSFGSVLSFTTPAAAPTTTTDAPTGIGTDTATLHGTATPNGDASTGYFRFGTTNPGTCSDSFGTRVPASGGTALGAGTSPVTFSQVVNGLANGTTYFFCGVASNTQGNGFGTVLSFTTEVPVMPPSVTTDAASAVTTSGATLNASATPNRGAATGWFRYDTTNPGACSDSFGTRVPASGGTALGAGTGPVTFSQPLTGLAAGTTYFACAIASNRAGVGFGQVSSFTVDAAAPVVTTTPTTEVIRDQAVLNGSVLTNGDMTSAWFRYDTSAPGTCDDTFGVRAPATGSISLNPRSGPQSYAHLVTGLVPGRTYYFCALAENTRGKAFGAVLPFAPDTVPPDVRTDPATNVAATTATLAGAANPNGTAALGWFRVGSTAPTTCDDTFGTRVPATDGTPLGAGTAQVTFTEPLTGLEPKRTYYVCAAALNLAGARFGEVRTFSTRPAAPLLSTQAARVELGEVTLAGTADPRGSPTTAWFRYGRTEPSACDDTYGTRAPSEGGIDVGTGRSEVAISQPLTGLAPGTYFACAMGQSEGGFGAGEVVRFEVPAPAASGCGCLVGASTRAEGGPSFLILSTLAVLACRRRPRR